MLCGAWLTPSGSIRSLFMEKAIPSGPAGYRPSKIISFANTPGQNVIFPKAIMGARIFQRKENQGVSRCGLADIWDGHRKEMVLGLPKRRLGTRPSQTIW